VYKYFHFLWRVQFVKTFNQQYFSHLSCQRWKTWIYFSGGWEYRRGV